NGSISVEDFLKDAQIIESLELAKIATHDFDLKNEKERNKTLKKQEENITKGKPKNMGCPWTLALRQKLITQFNNNIPTHIIANNIERTVGSIEYQLVNEGLMKEEETTYYKNKHSSPQSNPPEVNLKIHNNPNPPAQNDEDYPF
ncbi:MAG: hypothetical protein HON61_05925, partial [Alphaproteobacteria bacterium]|nr:hypothetical protein [Alphaproteobacteria bacterium]